GHRAGQNPQTYPQSVHSLCPQDQTPAHTTHDRPGQRPDHAPTTPTSQSLPSRITVSRNPRQTPENQHHLDESERGLQGDDDEVEPLTHPDYHEQSRREQNPDDSKTQTETVPIKMSSPLSASLLNRSRLLERHERNQHRRHRHQARPD